MTAARVVIAGSLVVNLGLMVLNVVLYAQDTSRWWNLGTAVLAAGATIYCALALGEPR